MTSQLRTSELDGCTRVRDEKPQCDQKSPRPKSYLYGSERAYGRRENIGTASLAPFALLGARQAHLRPP
eukprot:2650971-Prymnesium_polylepis.1